MFAGGTDFGDDLLLDDLAVFIDDVHQADAAGAGAGDGGGDIEVAEGGGELPFLAVLRPDLVLLEACQSTVVSCRLTVVSCP